MKTALLEELAGVWEIHAEEDPSATRRATLRECADTLRMLINAQRSPAWLPPEAAPKDGSLLRLLVQYGEHPMDDDTSEPQATIGMNNLGNTGVDEWQFAGWCWTHDRFTQGEGRVVGWLPLLDN